MLRSSGKSRGLTLIELIVALVVTLIVLSIGVPSFVRLSQSNARTTQLNDLVSGLQFARSRAIMGKDPVSVTRAFGGWTAGWTVFVDENADGILDDGEEILKVVERATPSFTINSTQYSNSITFDRTGNTISAAVFQYCGTESTAAVRTLHSRAIIVNGIGHVRFSRDDSGNGVHEDQSGNDLSCS